MDGFSETIASGIGNPWLLLPTAVILGALHGLEPGHSKSIMAAFIIAVRGTVLQACLLGLCAAISHVIIVWVLALIALTWGEALIGEELEHYLLMVSGIIVLLMALWMLRNLLGVGSGDSPHEHHHHDGTHHHDHDHPHPHRESVTAMDAHAAAHARDLENRFQDGAPSIWQIIVFGLTGGLMPCTAAITVLIVCLQLGNFGLGVAMVSAFSIGLALALIGVGVVTAWSVGRVRHHLPSFDRWASRLPYLSVCLVTGIGLAMLAGGVYGVH